MRRPLFTLVDSEGSEIGGEQLGLLLYKGGTVCDDYFDHTAADAICKYMGYTDAIRWTVHRSMVIQNDLMINLDDVECSSAEWEGCSFSEDHNCRHSEDVFLNCNPTGYLVYVRSQTSIGELSSASIVSAVFDLSQVIAIGYVISTQVQVTAFHALDFTISQCRRSIVRELILHLPFSLPL